MPELPEVETTLQGLRPYVEGQKLLEVEVRTPRMRLPMPAAAGLKGLTVMKAERRAKYLLLHLSNGTTLVLHLGMSGRMTVVPGGKRRNEPGKHDHLVLYTAKGQVILNDARRFGLVLHVPTESLATHPLLKDLGPEPLSEEFTARNLYATLAKRKGGIKPTLMDNKVVVGVGNIYASESLFRAGIHPEEAANSLPLERLEKLVVDIRQTLKEAIEAGGSTLRDYTHGEGQRGYFQNTFKVYKRENQPCPQCNTAVKRMVQGQRSTFFCPTCQKKERIAKRRKDC